MLCFWEFLASLEFTRRPEGCEADYKKSRIVSVSLCSPVECLRMSKSLHSGFQICELTDVELHLARCAMPSTTKATWPLPKLFVLWLLTIISDAVMVSSAFQNIKCSNSTSRKLFPVRPFEELRYFRCTHLQLRMSDLAYQKYST